MANDLTQRMMDAEADANLSIGGRDMQHTISSDADSDALVRRATEGSAVDTTGVQLHAELMRRAEEAQHLADSLGEGAQFFDYKRSSVGGIGGNREVRRELTLRSHQERVKREQRFGKATKRDPAKARQSGAGRRRQAFNATGGAESSSTSGGDRQAFNADTAQPRTYFQEPQARNYDPYSP